MAVFSLGGIKGFYEKTPNPVCFVAGTMVLTASGLTVIENIRAGDKVISTNADTFETDEKTVLETYIRRTDKLIHLVINGEEIITTETHPFYVKERGFVDAGKLLIGDFLLDVHGNILVVENTRTEYLDEPQTVYNFQVEDFHTYYVGGLFVLVHNASEAYRAIRKASPSPKIRDMINKKTGKKVHPVYGYEVEKLEADHIMPLKEITEQPGFDMLSLQDQIDVANTPENFIGLGRATNASKGAKPISEWYGHSKYGPISDEVRMELIRRDEIGRSAIKKAILERLNNGNT